MGKMPIGKILNYYWNSETIYSAHSPFVFDFFQHVMNGKVNLQLVSDLEQERTRLIKSKDDISFVDFGTGGGGARRPVSQIAKSSLSGAWQCAMLHKLSAHYGLKHILEMGTSLGISSAYLASADERNMVTTLEGNPESARIAKKVWSNLTLNNIHVEIGEFDNSLAKLKDSFQQIDLCFIDGNHRKAPTVAYFEELLPYKTQSSIYIIDDIYWSEEMHAAWNQIISHPSVAFSIDVFRMGLLFFDHNVMPKQHFKLISYKLKPWCIGLFG